MKLLTISSPSHRVKPRIHPFDRIPPILEKPKNIRVMIQYRRYMQKVDLYSFGIILWELITGMLTFQNMTAVQAAFAVVNKGVRPNIPTDCLPVLADIMTRCWDPNPDVRPPFTDIVKMLENAKMEIMQLFEKHVSDAALPSP